MTSVECLCGSEETHEIVHCIKCNKKMNPCDEMPNPVEYGKDDWICEECFNDLEIFYSPLTGDRD